MFMKKSLLLLTLLLYFHTAWGYDVEVDGIYYNLVKKNALVTYGDTKYEGNVIIPPSIKVKEESYPVIVIRKYAFSGCTGLKSVTIPNSVTSIEEYAFDNCI